MELTVKQMLGQKLVFGFHGAELPEEFIALIREYKIGNVILFRRNVESGAQLRRLCNQIQTVVQEVTGYPAFIVIDQEGGIVSRMPGDGVTVPGAMAVAATGETENARIAAEEFDNVVAIDSQNLSTGQGLVVLEACRLAKEVQSLTELKEKIEHQIVVKKDRSGGSRAKIEV